ncbi:hypothetical protein OH77DRAFT_1430000 [Trametes cingulata]|nr:hypothetical protein OH77DRAFT_1430000 [Trametes cingulata]
MSTSKKTRTGKRQRDDDEGGEGTSAHARQADASAGKCDFEHDEEFWLPDGNLILVAGNKGFRVYRGLLGSQCEIFRDMFSSSNPDIGQRYDDCPVVPLADSPEYLRYLLRVLLPTTHPSFFNHGPAGRCVSFHEVSAILRLAHKYGIADLEQQALCALRTRYVKSFKEFERDTYSENIDFFQIHAIGAVNYARLTGALDILPFAMYECCTLGGSIVDGWKREDGTVERLAHADLKRCLDGREVITHEAVRLLFRIFHPAPSAKCTAAKKCGKGIAAVLARMGCSENAVSTEVFDTWANAMPEDIKAYGICGSCEGMLLEHDRAERKKLWQQLPTFFALDIEDWGDDDAATEAQGKS